MLKSGDGRITNPWNDGSNSSSGSDSQHKTSMPRPFKETRFGRMKAPPIQRVHLCWYSSHGITHLIDPRVYKNDVIAKKDANGKWICGTCQEEEIKNMILKSKKRRGITA